MRPVLRWLAGAAVAGLGASVAVALAGGVVGADPADRYRVAAAAVGDVARTVSTNGTVDFVNRADVSFGTSGTLATLLVRPGQEVRAGQRLATLDTAALRAAADSAEADLAGAKAVLEADQQRQADSVDTAGDEPSGDAGDSARLRKQQQAVRAAQTAAGKAIAAAKAALAAQGKACDTPAPDAAGPAPGCAKALAAAMSAQQAVARAQDNLQQKVGELAATLSAAAASEKDTPAPDQETPQGQEPAPTAATIAADQAAVDTAEVDLATAKQALARATLTAPIAGTVASVDAAAGDEVGAGSALAVLIGAGAAVVETTVPVERIDEIEVGQPATVTPSGAADGVAGTVTRIGRLAADSSDAAGSGDSVAYPVTVTVEKPAANMPAGSTAGVDIVVDTAADVLTVPTSAVHGSTPATVTVLAGTEASPREVTVGAVGPLRTEITGGLAAGENVVLADLETPLPSSGERAGPGGIGGPGEVVVRSGPGGGPLVRNGR